VVQLCYDPPQEIEIDGISTRSSDVEGSDRVLLDGLDHGSSLGTRPTLSRFFHALIALMKEHRSTAVYNHENPEMLGMSSMMGDFAMSSLVDNIVLMNWIELEIRSARSDDREDALNHRPNDARVQVVDGKGMPAGRHLPVPKSAFQLQQPDLPCARPPAARGSPEKWPHRGR
jgi:hypothetical protein